MIWDHLLTEYGGCWRTVAASMTSFGCSKWSSFKRTEQPAKRKSVEGFGGDSRCLAKTVNSVHGKCIVIALSSSILQQNSPKKRGALRRHMKNDNQFRRDQNWNYLTLNGIFLIVLDIKKCAPGSLLGAGYFRQRVAFWRILHLRPTNCSRDLWLVTSLAPKAGPHFRPNAGERRPPFRHLAFD